MNMQDIKDRISTLFVIGLQLALLMVIFRQFQIESSAFLRVALLASGGFIIHAVLPLRFRLPFFLILSLAGIGIVFGIANGGWLVGLGALLVGVCHLPLPFPLRVILLLLMGVLLALLRLDWLHAPWSQAIWPILGSMFMFRLIVYMYDLRHDKTSFSVWRTFSYFFMLPNVCFPLFPVVDYKTFARNHFDQDPRKIYQLGVDWMFRGAFQLILYRFVYQYLTMSPTEVFGPGDLTRYLVSNFLLYLRVSGQFHLIVGMLHLFGFRLPETHHLYYLASSFTDFWRRINIYWKDFMMKVFYYPTYFRLRKLGNTQALIISTLIVFTLTWFFHAYQWFWLRGAFLLTIPDTVFWAVLAVLVLINALYETKYGRQRKLGKHSWNFGSLANRVLSTVGTFAVICALWSLWTSESLSAWASLWSSVRNMGAVDAKFFSTLLVAAVALGGSGLLGVSKRPAGKASSNQAQTRVGKLPFGTLAGLVFLALAGMPEVYSRLGHSAASVIYSLRSGSLSRVDNAALERGYYEDLIRVDRFNSQLWQVYMNKPLNWLDVQGTGLERFTGNFQQKELVPSVSSQTSYAKISTNRWGMRDKDYEKQPAPASLRIAMLGASTVMGWGVEDDQTFEAVLESRLNRELVGQPFGSYEVLNFGVPGYRPPQQLGALDKALAFKPDVVFYIATSREASQSVLHLADAVRHKVEVPYDFLRSAITKAGVESTSEETMAIRNLEVHREEILSRLYRRIVEQCRSHGVTPVWVFMPMVLANPWEDAPDSLFRTAKESGFVVLNLIDIFKGRDISQLRLADWDTHPNAEAHRLLADRLYEAVLERQEQIFSPYLPKLQSGAVQTEQKPLQKRLEDN